MLKETEVAAGAFGVQAQYFNARVSNDLEGAFREAVKRRAEAGVVLAGAVIFALRARIAALAAANKFPMIYPQSEYVEDGGLISYAPNYPDLFRRAATYVDKIVKGAKPGDLPV